MRGGNTVAGILGRGVRFALCLGYMAIGAAGASAATAPIYKCVDRNLGVLYTDVPCKDGERVDIRAGDADPAAVARLERERDALDRSAAQRIADDRRAALHRRHDAAPAYVMADDAMAYADAAEYLPFGWGYAWGYAPERRRIPEARPDRRAEPARVVPARPRLPGR
jgi:hypothetical protein